MKETPKILVVDDEPDITSSFQAFFGRRGFLVNTTASGRDALNIIKASKPDLVLLDLTLPKMSGKEVLEELRKHDKETKVVIITGHTLESEKEEKEFQSLGITAYLKKPLNLKQLTGIVKFVLKGDFSSKILEGNRLGRKANRMNNAEKTHRLKNILGNLRNQCEVFLLNKKDGIYNDKSEEDLEKMSEEIIQDVIKTVDQTMEVLEGTKKK